MEPDASDPYVKYVTPVESEAPKLNPHQAYYQRARRNSRRLKQESRERRHRSRKKFETLPKSEQEEILERRRKSSAVYREKHRDELRVKERLRRQRKKATTERSEKL